MDDYFNKCLEAKTMNQGLIDTLSLDCLKRNDETAKFKVKWGISSGVGNSEELPGVRRQAANTRPYL